MSPTISRRLRTPRSRTADATRGSTSADPTRTQSIRIIRLVATKTNRTHLPIQVSTPDLPGHHSTTSSRCAGQTQVSRMRTGDHPRSNRQTVGIDGTRTATNSLLFAASTALEAAGVRNPNTGLELLLQCNKCLAILVHIKLGLCTTVASCTSNRLARLGYQDRWYLQLPHTGQFAGGVRHPLLRG